MEYRLRDGTTTGSDETQDRLLSFLYETAAGTLLRTPLTKPALSKAAGCFLDSPLSLPLILRAIKHYHIPLEDYEPAFYQSYNAFFTRKIRKELRPIAPEPALIAPCDAKLSVYRITPRAEFLIKGHRFSTAALLGCEKTARQFSGGTCLIFRLTVDDYHRYCYPASGKKSQTRQIPGVLHTVNPIAYEKAKIYHVNQREVTLYRTPLFGLMAQVEVGALLVGRIHNRDRDKGTALRGEEKGMFLFGGSTVVLLLRQGAAHIDADLWRNTAEGAETVVHMGEKIGVSAGFLA